MKLGKKDGSVLAVLIRRPAPASSAAHISWIPAPGTLPAMMNPRSRSVRGSRGASEASESRVAGASRASSDSSSEGDVMPVAAASWDTASQRCGYAGLRQRSTVLARAAATRAEEQDAALRTREAESAISAGLLWVLSDVAAASSCSSMGQGSAS